MLFSTLDLMRRRLNGGTPISGWCRSAIVLSVVLAATPVMAGGPQAFVTLADGSGPIQMLGTGKDLHVDLAGLAPRGKYHVLLLDEASTVIAAREVVTDSTGEAETAEPLWPRSGVVGCDDDVVADPASYTFATFEDADAHLDGRRLSVEVREARTAMLVERRQLPVTSEAPTPTFYFADGSGCPRSRIKDDESLYLAARGLSGDGQNVIFFLVEGGFPPSPGEFLHDVREGAQMIAVDLGQTKFLELVWAAPVVGEYGGVARLDEDWTARFIDADTWIGATGSASGEFLGRISPHGITVVPWDCPGCPIDP